MDKLFKKLGVIPNESRLYMIAFSHSSYANENNLKSDYERLEFLGDAVLEIIVSDYCQGRYYFVDKTEDVTDLVETDEEISNFIQNAQIQ